MKSAMPSLEITIKQSKPLAPHEHSLVNLLLTHNYVHTRLTEILETFDLTPPQYNVLRILRGQNSNACGNSLIKERLLQKATDVTRLIDRIIDKGLAARNKGKDDRRCVDIVITPKGMELLQHIDEKLPEIAGIMANLSLAEADELSRLLDKVRG